MNVEKIARDISDDISVNTVEDLAGRSGRKLDEDDLKLIQELQDTQVL